MKDLVQIKAEKCENGCECAQNMRAHQQVDMGITGIDTNSHF